VINIAASSPPDGTPGPAVPVNSVALQVPDQNKFNPAWRTLLHIVQTTALSESELFRIAHIEHPSGFGHLPVKTRLGQ